MKIYIWQTYWTPSWIPRNAQRWQGVIIQNLEWQCLYLKNTSRKKLYTRFPGPSKIDHYAAGLVHGNQITQNRSQIQNLWKSPSACMKTEISKFATQSPLIFGTRKSSFLSDQRHLTTWSTSLQMSPYALFCVSRLITLLKKMYRDSGWFVYSAHAWILASGCKMHFPCFTCTGIRLLKTVHKFKISENRPVSVWKLKSLNLLHNRHWFLVPVNCRFYRINVIWPRGRRHCRCLRMLYFVLVG